MSARAIVFAVVVTALCAAFYLFGSRGSVTVDDRAGSQAMGDASHVASGDDARTAPYVEQAAKTAPTDSGASSPSSDAQTNSALGDEPPPMLLAHQVPSTPIAQALEELEFPPLPELLETERMFAAERVDPLWAGAMEGYILGEIARTTGLQLVTLQVECRTSMCRLQLVEAPRGEQPSIVFPSVGPGLPGRAGSLGDFVSRLDLDARWVASVVDGNGTPTSLAYLARRDDAGAPRGAAAPSR